MIVIDASAALGWFLGDAPQIAALHYVEENGGVVPGNFQSEVVHGLLRAERRRRIDPADASRALQELLDLSLDVALPDARDVMATAREFGLTGYDATYLALARQMTLRLLTADAVLQRAAASIDLLWQSPR